MTRGSKQPGNLRWQDQHSRRQTSQVEHVGERALKLPQWLDKAMAHGTPVERTEVFALARAECPKYPPFKEWACFFMI